MDKEEWVVSLKSLKKVLARKEDILNTTLKNINRDIEELKFTISCYEKRIKEFTK
jgi:rubrerythrin